MAEIVSRQAAAVAAGGKMRFDEAMGSLKMVTISSPTTAAWAQNDTIASPELIRKGTRLTGLNKVYNEAMGTSVTMDIGLRAVDGTVIDADGIADDIAVATAGNADANNGVLVDENVPQGYTLEQDAYIYATLKSANPTDDAQFRIEIVVIPAG